VTTARFPLRRSDIFCFPSFLFVIAKSEATKQSMLRHRNYGLLRCARNDGVAA
jgi:hypothetical protein